MANTKIKIQAIDRSIEQIQKSINEKHPIKTISLYKNSMSLLRCRFSESLTLRGHTSKISSLSWGLSTHSKSLSSTSTDGSILIWDIKTGSVVTKWYNPNSNLTCSAFESSTSEIFSAGSFEGRCFLYNTNSVKDYPLLVINAHEEYISDLVFISLKSLATVSGDKKVRLWDLEKNSMVAEFNGHGEDVMCIDNCGDLIVTGSCDNSAKLWDIRQDKAVRSYPVHLGDVNSVKFISNYTFVTGSSDGHMRLLDMRGLNVLGHYKTGGKVESIEASYSGRVLFTAGEGDVKVWDIMTESSPIQVLPRVCSCIGLDKNGTFLAGAEGENLTLWQHIIYSRN